MIRVSETAIDNCNNCVKALVKGLQLTHGNTGGLPQSTTGLISNELYKKKDRSL
jgi:hypothetical protein